MSNVTDDRVIYPYTALGFDDFSYTTFLQVDPILKTYGLKATMSGLTKKAGTVASALENNTNPDTSMTPEQLQEMYATGRWGIWLHGEHHKIWALGTKGGNIASDLITSTDMVWATYEPMLASLLRGKADLERAINFNLVNPSLPYHATTNPRTVPNGNNYVCDGIITPGDQIGIAGWCAMWEAGIKYCSIAQEGGWLPSDSAIYRRRCPSLDPSQNNEEPAGRYICPPPGVYTNAPYNVPSIGSIDEYLPNGTFTFETMQQELEKRFTWETERRYIHRSVRRHYVYSDARIAAEQALRDGKYCSSVSFFEATVKWLIDHNVKIVDGLGELSRLSSFDWLQNIWYAKDDNGKSVNLARGAHFRHRRWDSTRQTPPLTPECVSGDLDIGLPPYSWIAPPVGTPDCYDFNALNDGSLLSRIDDKVCGYLRRTHGEDIHGYRRLRVPMIGQIGRYELSFMVRRTIGTSMYFDFTMSAIQHDDLGGIKTFSLPISGDSNVRTLANLDKVKAGTNLANANAVIGTGTGWVEFEYEVDIPATCVGLQIVLSAVTTGAATGDTLDIGDFIVRRKGPATGAFGSMLKPIEVLGTKNMALA